MRKHDLTVVLKGICAEFSKRSLCISPKPLGRFIRDFNAVL